MMANLLRNGLNLFDFKLDHDFMEFLVHMGQFPDLVFNAPGLRKSRHTGCAHIHDILPGVLGPVHGILCVFGNGAGSMGDLI